MSNISDNPSPSVISHDLRMEDDSVREAALTNIASSIVDRHIDLATVFRATLVGEGDDGAADGGGGNSAADGAEIDDDGDDVATGHTKDGDDGGGGGSLYDCTCEG